MMEEGKIIINTTFKVEPSNLGSIEQQLRSVFEVIDLRIITNTDKMYQENETFKKLVKKVKEAQRERDDFINKYNDKYN